MTKGMRITKRDAVLDLRFVVVTDMGIIAKSPTARAMCRAVRIPASRSVARKVSVVAKTAPHNRWSRTTGSDGHAAFPPLHDFRNEQMAVMFPAEKRGCSFRRSTSGGATGSRFRALIFTRCENPRKIRAPSAAISFGSRYLPAGETFHAAYHPHL